MNADSSRPPPATATRIRRAGADRTLLLAAMLLCFSLRAFYAFVHVGTERLFAGIYGDAHDFLTTAYTLEHTGVYGNPTNDVVAAMVLGNTVSPQQVRPSAWRPPVWTFTLAALLRVTGDHLAWVLALKFLIDAAVLFFLDTLLIRQGVTRWIRAAGLAVFALHPTGLLYSATFLSEPFTLFLHIAFATSAVVWLSAPNIRRAVMCGALGGLLALSHPFHSLFPPFVLAAAALSRRVAWRQVAACGALFLVIVGLWMARNSMVFKTTSPVLTTSSGGVLAMSWTTTFLARYRNTNAEVELGPDRDAPNTGNDAERSAAMLRIALDSALRQWRVWPAIVARKLVGAITPVPETYRPGFLELGRASFQAVGLIPLMIFLAARRGDGQIRLVILCAVLAYLASAVLFYTSLRFRAPLIWVEWYAVVVWVASRLQNPELEHRA